MKQTADHKLQYQTSALLAGDKNILIQKNFQRNVKQAYRSKNVQCRMGVHLWRCFSTLLHDFPNNFVKIAKERQDVKTN